MYNSLLVFDQHCSPYWKDRYTYFFTETRDRKGKRKQMTINNRLRWRMRMYQALLIVQCDLVKIYITNMNKGIWLKLLFVALQYFLFFTQVTLMCSPCDGCCQKREGRPKPLEGKEKRKLKERLNVHVTNMLPRRSTEIKQNNKINIQQE